jgi:hypothetical protein
VDFHADVKPTLTGFVVEEGIGPAPPGLRVTALPIGSISMAEAYAVVDEHGSYTFSALPPGRYALGVNISEPPTLRRPFRPRYHSSSITKEGALPVDLREPGVRIDLMTGSRIRQRTVEGTVVNGLGRPVANAHIYVNDTELPQLASLSEAIVRADAGGRFRAVVLEGRRYTFTSFTSGPPGPPGTTQIVANDITNLVVVQSVTHPWVIFRDLLGIGVDWIRSVVGWE